jgi:hypothetical protein
MEEMHETIKDLLDNDPSYTILQLHYEAVKNAPFSFDLYQQRFDTITDAEFDTFFRQLVDQALPANHTVNEVLVDWRFFRILSKEDRKLLTKCIGKLERLENLEISGLAADPFGVELSLATLTESLVYNTQLQKLSFDGSGCIAVGSQLELDNFVHTIRAMPCLAELSIGNLLISFPSEPSAGFLDGMVQSIVALPNLSILQLSVIFHRMRLLRAPAVTPDVLAAVSPRYKILTLDNCGLNDEHCIALATPCNGSRLEALSLIENRSIGFEGRKSLLGLVRQTSCFTQLRTDTLEQYFEIDADIEVALHINQSRRRRHGSFSLLELPDCLARLSQLGGTLWRNDRYFLFDIPLSAIYSFLLQYPEIFECQLRK